MKMNTAYRWRILRRNEDHAAWALIWSFENKLAAEKMLTKLAAKRPATWDYKLIDSGRVTELVELPEH